MYVTVGKVGRLCKYIVPDIVDCPLLRPLFVEDIYLPRYLYLPKGTLPYTWKVQWSVLEGSPYLRADIGSRVR